MRTIPYFRNDPVLVLILSIVTCGLYLIYWNYKMAFVLNAIAGRELMSPTLALISGCCLPLNLYFYYQAGQGLEKIGELVHNPTIRDKSVMLMVLGFFFPMVSAMIIQGHVNEIYDR